MEEKRPPLLDSGLTICLLRYTDMISSLFKSSAIFNIRNSAVSFHKFATWRKHLAAVSTDSSQKGELMGFWHILQLTLKNTAIFFLMHCGHLLIKMVRKVLFTHFPVAEKEIETGYKPFTKSCNNLVAELLTDAWISESFYPLLPWHRTPLLLASNFVWKTFLRKCYASEIWASWMWKEIIR